MNKFLVVCALFLAALAPLPAAAALSVDVTQGNAQPLPIAIPDMIAADPAQAAMGANIASVVRADLTRSGLFRSIDDGAHWRRINDDAHQYGEIGQVTGDPRVFGRVYFATGGRGIFYGDPVASPVAGTATTESP